MLPLLYQFGTKLGSQKPSSKSRPWTEVELLNREISAASVRGLELWQRLADKLVGDAFVKLAAIVWPKTPNEPFEFCGEPSVHEENSFRRR